MYCDVERKRSVDVKMVKMKTIRQIILGLFVIPMLVGCIDNLNIHGDYNELDDKYVYCI